MLQSRRTDQAIRWLCVVAGLSLLLIARQADAHALKENYVWVNVEVDHVSGRFEIHKRDIQGKLGIELRSGPNDSEEDLLNSIRASAPQVQSYLQAHFSLTYNGAEQALQFLEPSLFDDQGSPFIQYPFRADDVPRDDLITIRNSVFLDREFLDDDPLHRSLIVIEYNKFRGLEFGHENTALVFGPHLQQAELNVAEPPQILIWKDFFRQGLLHIWLGLDHILFLLPLLLTAVLVRQDGQWQAVQRWQGVFLNILKIITIFTISHSITLALAVLGLVDVPATPVEAIIALSIAVVALNNVFVWLKSHTWALIFLFGLIHGLGFASAMGDLQFRNVQIEKILVMFNIGIEVGQIIIVLLLLPAFYILRKSPAYIKVIMPGLSLASAALALFWFGQRLNWWS